MQNKRRRRVVVLALVGSLVAWHQLRGGQAELGTAVLPATLPPAADGDRLIVEPDDGMQPIYSLLASPRRSLDLTMYELDDPTAESILADDAARGVAVRVVLDHRLEAAHNKSAFDFLEARQVTVHWASARYFVTHEKVCLRHESAAEPSGDLHACQQGQIGHASQR